MSDTRVLHAPLFGTSFRAERFPTVNPFDPADEDQFYARMCVECEDAYATHWDPNYPTNDRPLIVCEKCARRWLKEDREEIQARIRDGELDPRYVENLALVLRRHPLVCENCGQPTRVRGERSSRCSDCGFTEALE